MSTPFSFSGTLKVPLDLGIPEEMLNVAFASAYDQYCLSKMDLVGAGTKSVPFGNLGAPGAKFVLIKVDASATAAPVQLRWNGGGALGQQEIAPGGFLLLGSSVPVAGMTSLDVVFTTNVTVRALVFG